MMESENHQENQARRLAELQAIVSSVLSGPEGIEAYEQIAKFAQELRTKHPDLENYSLFHLLAGSTLNPEREHEFDLPNSEMEQFIRGLKDKA